MSRRTTHSTLSPARLVTVVCELLVVLLILPGYGPRIAHGASVQRRAVENPVLLIVRGHGNRTTHAVSVPKHWTLQWAYACSRSRHGFQVAAYRHGRSTAVASVTRHDQAGHGALQVRSGGSVHLVVQSACAWTVAMMRLPASTPTPTPTATPSPTATSTPTATPVPTAAVGLALYVSGNQLINQQGQAIRLIGVNLPAGAECIPTGPHTPPGIFAFPSATQTAAAIVGWHANLVRLTLNEDCWLGINGGDPAYTGDNYRVAIVNLVDDLHVAGLYVVLDLHANAPGATPSTSQQVMADADHATAYWTSVANTFKNDPAVIFQPYNEPHITAANAQTTNPWHCWRDGCTIEELDQYHNTPIPGAAPWQSAGMQSLVDAIRATGATNPILIDGLNWAQDLTQLVQYLPTDPLHQLIADYHNYMSPGSKNTPAYWNTVIAPIAARMPVMTSEFGEKDCGSTYVTQYMQWADQHDVSYAPWLWMTWDCSAMGLILDWNGTPSTYGRPFYDHFHAIGFNSG